MRALPLSLRTGVFVVAVASCGGEITTEVVPPAPCVDEEVPSLGQATALDVSGDAVAWGTENGGVFIHEHGVTSILGHAGSAPVTGIAMDGARVLAVSEQGLMAFSRTAAPTVILVEVDRPVALSARGGRSCLVERGATRFGTLHCWTGAKPDLVQSGLVDAGGLALDGAAAYVGVYGVTGTTIAGGRIVRVPFDGSAPTAVAVAPRPRFVIDDGNVYVARDGGASTVLHAWFVAYPKLGPLDADAPERIVGDDPGTLSGLAVGGPYLFAAIYRGPSDDVLLRNPLDSGPPETLGHLDDGTTYGELRVTDRMLVVAIHGTSPRLEKRCR